MFHLVVSSCQSYSRNGGANGQVGPLDVFKLQDRGNSQSVCDSQIEKYLADQKHLRSNWTQRTYYLGGSNMSRGTEFGPFENRNLQHEIDS